ncbi:hypothetical protein [Chromohalobacter sp. 296-RDG]|uniref:hypothetical protein n=1 Tax=Chromohalobacter sp. 296-RDG TaxID=2994062 RepID=UPI0024695661|nr:hypothetical protein [Chromohalobacter sp. 296-RDG]
MLASRNSALGVQRSSFWYTSCFNKNIEWQIDDGAQVAASDIASGVPSRASLIYPMALDDGRYIDSSTLEGQACTPGIDIDRDSRRKRIHIKSLT